VEHREAAAGAVSCAVLTASDTRTEASDGSGRLIQDLLCRAGHRVPDYRILRDDPAVIRQWLSELAKRPDVEAIVVNGGTGISRRDSTFEAVDGLLEKRLPGFGELFRALSFHEIGAAAMLSRATAGIYAGRAVFSVPGSTAAVRLAMERLILPELSHVVWLAAGRDAADPGTRHAGHEPHGHGHGHGHGHSAGKTPR
jgi:molybdenum cofactor biosynthesis protein B